MFKVVIKQIANFNVVVKGMATLNSWRVNLKTNTAKISMTLFERINESVVISDSLKISIGEFIDKINPRLNVKIKNKIEANISSREHFGQTSITSSNEFLAQIYSKEKISSTIKHKLSIIANPSIGVFRKLIEFDNLTLSEIDDLSLEEMDYVLTVYNTMTGELENI